MSGDMSGDDPLAATVGERLAGWPRQRITLAELEEVVITERPELNASVELGRRLSEVVEALVDQGVVQPAQRRISHRGARFPVSFLRPPTPTCERVRPALRHPWSSELAWAAETEGVTFERLRLLDQWLTANPSPPPAPVKERSLEIWGDEKLLDRLQRGPLRDRSIDGLQLVVVHPPLVVEQISNAGAGLLVENATTWWSLVTTARLHLAAGAVTTIGWIAYGAGNQVGAAVPGLADKRPTALWYFGDLDGRGLCFADDASRSAGLAGLPEVRPHQWLYQALLDIGRAQTRRGAWAWPERGLAWLGPELGPRVSAQHPATWLAQEWVGRSVLQSSPCWLVP